MKRLFEYINSFFRVRETGIIKGVDPAGEFAAVLNRERDRADRTGKGFSLVVFEVRADRGNLLSARALAERLTCRIRSTDNIGWLDDGRLAVVLPHTDAEGAWLLVSTVRKEIPEDTPYPECTVYAYPTLWIDGDDATPGDDPARKRDAASPRPAAGPEELHRASVLAREAVLPVEELGPHFLRRMPAWKRAIDLAGALAATILLSPLLAGVALFIKSVSPGPVFFRQERVGFLGQTFTLWKFRTMHVNADTAVHRQYLENLIHSESKMKKLDSGRDPRIIPFGGLLRASGIDELPQLLNILRGEMSLIGPRPCIPYEAKEFDVWQRRRFDAVPGLTGLWQVSGKNRTTFKEMMRFDIGYARRRALPLDLKILLKTFPAVATQVLDRPALQPVRSTLSTLYTRVGTTLISLLAVVTQYGRR